jgi:hypothetical protein
MPTNTWLELLDKAEAEGGGDFTPLPSADYDFVISEAEATKTNDGKKDMIKVKAKVVTGDFKNRQVFHNFTISPESTQALSILFREFAVLGLTRDTFWSQNPKPADFPAALVGKAFRGTVGTREYNGKTYNQINRFLSATESGRQAAAAVVSGAPSDAPAPTVAPADAPPPPAPAAATPAPVNEEAPAEASAPPVPSGAVPPPPPPPAPPSNF